MAGKSRTKIEYKASVNAEAKENSPSEELIILDGEQKKEKALPPSEMQWSVHDAGTVFSPCNETRSSVPPGVYKLEYSNQLGIYMRKNNQVLSDKLLRLPIPECNEIIDDVQQFWTSETKRKFVEYNTVYKRGIIVYGPPGNGKSYMMQIIISDLVKLGGVVLALDTVSCVENFVSFAQKFRKIEPTRPLIVIMEDIDNVIDAGSGVLSALMNILDGINQIDNVVYLATTNYPEKLQERIANRPSRFDRVYLVGAPNREVREFFIVNKLHKADVDKIDMTKWLDATDGLSLSHIKELIVSTIILDKKFDDVISHFESMKKPKNSRGSSSAVGFATNKVQASTAYGNTGNTGFVR